MKTKEVNLTPEEIQIVLEYRLEKGIISEDLFEKAMDDLVKAEGARGGKVIGHTKSGKPIYYASANDLKHKEFSADDHKDAAEIVGQKAAKYRDVWINKEGRHPRSKNKGEYDTLSAMSDAHERQAKSKSESK